MNRSSRQPMLVVVVAFAVGIFCDAQFPGSTLVWISICAIAFVLTLIAMRWQLHRVSGIALIIFLMSLGGIWHHMRWNLYPSNDISRWASNDAQPFVLEGVVSGETRPVGAANDHPLSISSRESRFIVPINVVRRKTASGWSPASGCVNVLARGEEIAYKTGDVIRLHGDVRLVEGPRNPGEFDFAWYYRSQRVNAWAYANGAEGIELVRDSRLLLNPSGRLRELIRRRLIASIERHVEEPYRDFAEAILLGRRSQLDPQQKDEFALTGTAHILAISGLHVGILVGVVFLVLRLCLVPRRWIFVVAILFVVAYAWLVEFRTPVTRAMILIALYCMGRLAGRAGMSLNSLALAALLVLVVNPSDLFSLGAQLSFLAVYSMTNIVERKREPLEPVAKLILTTRHWSIQEVYRGLQAMNRLFWTSLTIWLIAVPLVASNFHLFTLNSLWINPIVLPLVGLVLFWGLVYSFCKRLSSNSDGNGLGILEITGNDVWHRCIWREYSRGHHWVVGPNGLAVLTFYVGLLAMKVINPNGFSGKARIVLDRMGWSILAWADWNSEHLEHFAG
ncbi:MAG: ComEC/Rec2 family competence protein [Pirellulaceae bacterium]